MKPNRFVSAFLCLLVFLMLQGCNRKDATSTKKTSGGAYKVEDMKTGTTLTFNFDSPPSQADIDKKFSEYYLKTFNETKANAERGDAAAQYKLGYAYEDGLGVTKDLSEAVKWFQKSAEQGNADAQWHLGKCYYYGRGTTKDSDAAIKWYQKAAEQGNAEAQSALGDIYHYGDGVAEDFAKAAMWYRKAAEQNSISGQMMLGLCYENGEGVETNLAEAAKCYRKAAEQGNLEAQVMLGTCYHEGKGVLKDFATAVSLFRKAANSGFTDAQINLGRCYLYGQGVPKDYIVAYKWFNLASTETLAGDISESAKKYIGILEQQMTPEQIAEAQRLTREFQPSKESDSNNSVSSDNPTATGTGFFITDDGYLISNYHVVKGAAKVRLLTGAGLIDATVVKVDAANDLALLKAVGRFAPLPIAASRTVKLGGTVATVGFPDIGLQGFAPKLARN